MSDPTDDVAADMEMTTKEAAAYLSGPVGWEISPKIMYSLKSFGRGPLVEKRGSRLVYRKSALDAFLRENGTNVRAWVPDLYRTTIEQIRAMTDDPALLQIADKLDEMSTPEDWNPDDAR